MKRFALTVLLVHITNACLEPASTTVHIQNYEGPIYVTPGDSRSVHLASTDNRYPCTTVTQTDNRHPTLFNDNPNILHNNVPYQTSTCETDCKCVTKQQSYVPVAVNAVPQNICTTGYPCYPDGYYGYAYPDTDVPKISETLIPLLKTYFSQGSGCNNRCSRCGRKH